MSQGRAAIAELRRYPVKSMQGERLEAADVIEAGLAGDRAYAVVDPATGKVGSAKHPRRWGALLQCRARFLGEPGAGAPIPAVGITLPDGSETGSEDPAVDERLSAVFGRPVQLTTVAPEGNGYLVVWPEMDGVVPDDFRAQHAVEGAEADGTLTDLALALAAPPGTFFDVSALHVVTVATLRRLGELEPGSRFTVERYRPNIVIDSDGEPFAENGWSGSGVRFGAELTASVLIPTMRCIMTTLAQGELPGTTPSSAPLRATTGWRSPDWAPGRAVGAYVTVGTPGRIALGDEVAFG